MARVIRLVKPVRAANKDKSRREIWWRFTRPAPELYDAIANLDHVTVMAQVSSTLLPVRIPNGQVYNHKCVVFASESLDLLALLSSSIHQSWAMRYTSTMRVDISYSPSDVFLTLPRPPLTVELAKLGERLDTDRRSLMLGRGLGLTKLYNLVHDPTATDPEIARLREIHEEIDHAVLAAYGWSDIDPKVWHYPTKIGTRWTFCLDARYELLDRLLAENHRRYAVETVKG